MKLAVFHGVAFNSDGSLAPNADVEVRYESAGTLAAIFSDADGASPITQPGFQADASGIIKFYAYGAADGYKVDVDTGTETYSMRNVAVGNAAQVDVTDYTAALLGVADEMSMRAYIGAAAAKAYEERTADTTLDTDDDGKAIHATDSFTQTFDPVGDLPVNWRLAYKVAAGEVVVFDPDGSEQIDGATTKRVVGPAKGYIYSDGTEFHTFGFDTEEEVLSVFTRGIGGLHTQLAADTDHDITINPGFVISDDGAKFLTLGAAITKQIDASWAVGTGAGGMDTGSVTTNTIYYLWLIRRPDTGVVDALFSTSSSAPTMPANYTQKALIAAYRTDASSNLLPFYQAGDWFYYRTPPSILSGGTSTGEASVTYTGFVPSIARKMKLRVNTAFTYGNVINAQNFTQIRVFTGVFFRQQGGYQTGNTGNFSEENEMTVPVTGNLYYFQSPANHTSASSSIGVAGFNLPRGGV